MRTASVCFCFSIFAITMQLSISLGQRILDKVSTRTCRTVYEEADIEQLFLGQMRPAFVSLVSSVTHELSAKINELTRQVEKLTNKSEFQCPGRDGEWKAFSNVCYFFSSTKETWDNAKASCKGMESDLVAITSSAENKFIKTYLITYGSKGIFWTSGTDISEMGKWIWSATHQAIQYKDWHPGQPNGGERCLALDFRTGFSWHDYSCTGTQFFICEARQIGSG